MTGDNDGNVPRRRDRLVAFWSEVRRRKVFRAGSIYLIAMWTLSLGAAELFPAFGIPDWAVRMFVIAGVLGFPLVLVGAWVFEITSEGVVLDRVAKQPRQPADATQIDAGAATTTWAQRHEVTVHWEDESGRHDRSFQGDFVMGRDRLAELCIDDPRISRLHARVTYERGMWWIEDLASRNGTNVNGRLITDKTPIGEGGMVRLYEGGEPISLRVGSVVRGS